MFDIVIIGNGIVGHSIAFRLKRRCPELDIAVLGDPMNSLMASRAAAGMLAPFGECDTADRFFEFCRGALGKYPSFIQELTAVSGTPVYFSMNGSLMPSSQFERDWDERKRFFHEQDIPHEIWSPEKVRQKVPFLSEECGETIWVGEGQVNNREMHDALIAASRKLGVNLQGHDVTGFSRDDSSIQAAVAGTVMVPGRKFILAAGSWSGKLGEALNVDLPMKPIKGQMCRVQVDDNRLEYTVHGLLTYIAPWRGGKGFVIGSTMEDRGFDDSVEEVVIRGLIDRAAKILPCLKQAPLIEKWTGLRPAPDDLMPIMGKSGRYDNLFYSTGHYRNGVLQTPEQADYLADVILDSLDEEIPEFSPSRYNL